MARDQLSQAFSALADPTRRAILARLATGDLSVGELAEPFDMSLPAISSHLKVLEQAGLIRREVEAQRRRCRLTPEGLEKARDYIEQLREFWETSFGRLDRYLADVTGGNDKRKGERDE